MKTTIALRDFLTDKQIAEVIRIKDRKQILNLIIEPNMETINKKLRRENDACFLSYVIEYALSTM